MLLAFPARLLLSEGGQLSGGGPPGGDAGVPLLQGLRAGGEIYLGGPGEESREEWRTDAETGRLVLPLR